MPPFSAIEQVISQDPGNRGVGPLILPGQVLDAAQSLLQSQFVVIPTGFYVLTAGAFETDGPPGAWALEHALSALGIATQLLTDPDFVHVLSLQAAGPIAAYREGWSPEPVPSHFVSIERCGRAADSRYYNLRGLDITPFTAPLDDLFLNAQAAGIETIGIGDGGNEIGMGRVLPLVKTSIPNGEQIACVVPTDKLIVSGVSNWGAWGLVAAMSVLAKRNLLPSRADEITRIQCLVENGVVDGKTGCNEPTVDGLTADVYLQVLDDLHRIVNWELSR